MAKLPPNEWTRETPAEGWSILDRVAHLAFFDNSATLALSDVASFNRQLEEAENEPLHLIDVHLGRDVDSVRTL